MEIDDTLSLQNLRDALSPGGTWPSSEPFIVLHPSHWDDLKVQFNLTDEQMGKMFVKSTGYIEVNDDTV